MPYKCTLFINVLDQGVSVTLFNTQAQDLEAAFFATARWSAVHMAVLPSNCYLLAMRCVDVSTPRLGETRPTRPDGITIGKGAILASIDLPQEGAFFQCWSGNKYHHPYWVRPIRDSAFSVARDTGQMLLSDTYIGELLPLRTLLTTGGEGWGMRALMKGTPEVAPKRVTRAFLRPADAALIMEVKGHNLQGGEYVRVAGLKGVNLRRAYGVWQCFKVDDNNVGIPVLYPTGMPFNYVQGGTVTLQKYDYFPFNRSAAPVASSKKVGRAFFSLRGRRLVRAR